MFQEVADLTVNQVGVGRNTAPPPVEDKGVVLRALKKGEIEQNPFCEDNDYFSIAELQLLTT